MVPFEKTFQLYDDIYGQRIDWKKFLLHYNASFGEQFSSEMKVIDFGCGTGSFSKILASNCASLFCVDKSRKMLELARSNLSEFDNVEFLQSGSSLVKTIKDATLLISTFHVVNYFLRKEDLIELFEFGKSSKERRKMVIEFWTQDSIEKHPPVGLRERQIVSKSNQKLVRQSITKKKNQHYEITHTFFKITNSERVHLFSETHIMRPWLLQEVLTIAKNAGFFLCGLKQDFSGNSYTVNSRQCVIYFMGE